MFPDFAPPDTPRHRGAGHVLLPDPVANSPISRLEQPPHREGAIAVSSVLFSPG